MQSSEILLTVDAIVFGYHQKQMNVLLIRRQYAPFENKWALPGGFVLPGESLETAVERELKEETGVAINYLEQLYTFGNPDRDPRQRIVTVAYFGLVNPEQFEIVASTDASEVQWFPVDQLPALAFDHQKILHYALQRLRNKLTYEPVGLNLLDTDFPFSDLENLYETILGRKIERRNFRRKFMGFGILKEVKLRRTAQKGRPGILFRFDKAKYNTLREKGFLFEIK
jgi:8-oxo-dGTP diphosphatase